MKILIITLMLFLVGCASTPSPDSRSSNLSDTMRIIEAAAEAAPNGVAGDFKFYIKASGKQGGAVYLNTEQDYRDPRNVSVAIHPSLVQYLAHELGQSPEQFFVDKTIRVRGEAKTVQIFFTSFGGALSDKYYFQTHVNVNQPDQIEVL